MDIREDPSHICAAYDFAPFGCGVLCGHSDPLPEREARALADRLRQRAEQGLHLLPREQSCLVIVWHREHGDCEVIFAVYKPTPPTDDGERVERAA